MKNLKALIISSLITISPILAGIILWHKLPEKMPIHWNSAGEVDSYIAKPYAIFLLPFILLLLHFLCLFITQKDANNKEQSRKIMNITIFICPIISIFANLATYFGALQIEFPIMKALSILFGILFIIIGNYLPKCKYNRTIGIRIPTTLKSEDNWNRTHRLGGKIFVIGGFIALICCLLPSIYLPFVLTPTLIVSAAIPIIYSVITYKK